MPVSELFSVVANLHKDGVGVQVRHIPVISIDEEDQLWQMNVIEPKGLQTAVLYYVGMVCCKRKGRTTKFEDITVHSLQQS